MNERAPTATPPAIEIDVGGAPRNVAFPNGPGIVIGVQLVKVFQSEPGPAHVAFWAEATPETPFKTMTGIAMRAARLSAALAVARRHGRFGSGSPNGREPFVRRQARSTTKGTRASDRTEQH